MTRHSPSAASGRCRSRTAGSSATPTRCGWRRNEHDAAAGRARMNGIIQGWRLARRELRGGLKSLRIVLACLALGGAASAAVGTLRAATQAGLAADGARLLGGDLEVRTSQRPIGAPALDWATRRGAHVSEVVEMRAMAVAPSGERS